MNNFLKSLLLVPLIFLGSCIVPVSLNYETADTTEKGKFETSVYADMNLPRSSHAIDSGTTINDIAFGGKIAFGLNERSNMSIHYQSKFMPDYFSGIRQNFLEFQYKVGIGKNYLNPDVRRRWALGLPVQFYFYRFEDVDYAAACLNPRVYYTFFQNDKGLQFTVVPKLYFVIDRFAILQDIPVIFGYGASINMCYTPNRFPQYSVFAAGGVIGLSLFDVGLGLRYNFGKN